MEFRDLYDDKKRLTGEKIQKGVSVPPGRYYITVVVFIENTKGEFLLQKRVKKKDGKWATTGGHPITGESSLEGIITEIKEELGIKVNQNELTLFKTIKTEDDFVDLYYMKKEINLKDIQMQKEEVEDVMWASKSKIENMIKNKMISSSHEEFYKECINFLEN